MSRAESTTGIELSEGDVVRVSGNTAVLYGEAVTSGPNPRIVLPERVTTTRASSLPDGAVSRLDNFDHVLGVDVEGETHLWSERRELAAHFDGAELVDSDRVSKDRLTAYLKWVDTQRGWQWSTVMSRYAKLKYGSQE